MKEGSETSDKDNAEDPEHEDLDLKKVSSRKGKKKETSKKEVDENFDKMSKDLETEKRKLTKILMTEKSRMKI